MHTLPPKRIRRHFTRIFALMLSVLFFCQPAAALAEGRQPAIETTGGRIETTDGKTIYPSAVTAALPRTGDQITLDVANGSVASEFRFQLKQMEELAAQNPAGVWQIRLSEITLQIPWNPDAYPELSDIPAQGDVPVQSAGDDETGPELCIQVEPPARQAQEAESLYAARFPDGRMVSGFYRLSITLTGLSDSAADFTFRQLNRPIRVSIVTASNSNAVLGYDPETRSFYAVSARVKGAAAELTTHRPGVWAAVHNAADFADVRGHWAEVPILMASGRMLVDGIGGGYYQPDRAITRAEFSKLIAGAMELPPVDGVPSYTDVPASAWYADPISRLEAVGMLGAFPGSRFDPDRPITRQEVAAMLAAAVRIWRDFPAEPKDLAKFTDAAEISAAFRSDVSAVVSLGIMQGMSADRFEPAGHSTRAQAAAVLINLLRSLDLIDQTDTAFTPGMIYSSAAMLMRIDNGEVLLEKEADMQIYPASMTKIMTALVLLENWDAVPETITLNADIFPELKKAGSTMAGYQAGETANKLDLLYGTMLPSGGECSHALARALAGSDWYFVQLMNEKAASLGMQATRFENPSGLHHPQHYTTIRDFTLLFRSALQNETLKTILQTRSWQAPPTDMHPAGLTFQNGIFTRLAASEFSGTGRILGGKTGYTGQAGQCLASFAEKDGVQYLFISAGKGLKSNGKRYNTDDALTVYSRLL